MMKNEIKERLREKLSLKLYRHSIATQEWALELAGIYEVDLEKASLAGLLHDCAKYMSHNELLLNSTRYQIPVDKIQSVQPGLLHAPVGARIANMEFGINDDEILHAIKIHNTGFSGMSKLDKILYMADATEPNRDYPDVQYIRDIALSGDMDGAALETMNMKIRHVIERGSLLHPMSIEARNDILLTIRNR
jgi:predicted HD superfamily hydrolase involved in NAD metabolism